MGASASTLALPFASAQYGRRPARRGDWELRAGPMSLGRDLRSLARAMYVRTPR